MSVGWSRKKKGGDQSNNPAIQLTWRFKGEGRGKQVKKSSPSYGRKSSQGWSEGKGGTKISSILRGRGVCRTPRTWGGGTEGISTRKSNLPKGRGVVVAGGQGCRIGVQNILNQEMDCKMGRKNKMQKRNRKSRSEPLKEGILGVRKIPTIGLHAENPGGENEVTISGIGLEC